MVRNVQSTSINLDLEQVQKTKLTDNYFVEYIYHKLFDNHNYTFDQVDPNLATWNYPLCWLARYYLYYTMHQPMLKDANILDIGSNLNFYSAWAILNGANHVHSFEADIERYNLGIEYIKLRGLENKISTENCSIDDFIKNYDSSKQYDVVFFLDVLYYLNNGINVLQFIKDVIKPKFLFVESTIVDDLTEDGHFTLWYPSTDSKKFQSYKNNPLKTGLIPSRNALFNILTSQGWKIITYYDYHNFIGRGESPPRREGKKDFYVLES
jgi:2-polyprenyl-3-methyl-5-hydroxy-6-metoxy-1,4-benzoquinol methylase